MLEQEESGRSHAPLPWSFSIYHIITVRYKNHKEASQMQSAQSTQTSAFIHTPLSLWLCECTSICMFMAFYVYAYLMTATSWHRADALSPLKRRLSTYPHPIAIPNLLWQRSFVSDFVIRKVKCLGSSWDVAQSLKHLLHNSKFGSLTPTYTPRYEGACVQTQVLGSRDRWTTRTYSHQVELNQWAPDSMRNPLSKYTVDSN